MRAAALVLVLPERIVALLVAALADATAVLRLFALYYCLGIIYPLHFLICFFPKWHNRKIFSC